MPRPKGAKNKKHVFKDPTIEEIVEEWVEFTCPVRGKVRQLVKIKRLKKMSSEAKQFMGAQSLVDELESKEGDEISGTEPNPEE